MSVKINGLIFCVGMFSVVLYSFIDSSGMSRVIWKECCGDDKNIGSKGL